MYYAKTDEIWKDSVTMQNSALSLPPQALIVLISCSVPIYPLPFGPEALFKLSLCP